MEVYESPKMEVIAFDSEDVIITSCTVVSPTCAGDNGNKSNGGTP